MRKVLVVDDSALMRKTMCDIIDSVPGFEVTDICRDGTGALKAISDKVYDCIVMNIYLGGVSSISLLRRLRDRRCRTPVIAITSAVSEDREMTMQALDAGAVDVVVRPYFFGDKAGIEKFKTSLLSSLKVASAGNVSFDFNDSVQHTDKSVSKRKGHYSLIALACSTGGPQALHTLIPMLPARIGVPMVVVQHMPAGFTASLAERIDQDSKIHVCEAKDQEVLKADTVYIAQGGRHFSIAENKRGQLIAHIYDTPPVHNLRPCADVMYESLCRVKANNILCVVLTGMGADGTEGIGKLKDCKNIYTISQDEKSSVVYGMPRSVHDKGLSDEVKPLKEIAKAITRELGV
ncbi:MAG: chemotaxis-specific protein-glutamate methyltransferase CheB [Lachnospiraceae bacterium]|uniref:Stage 0 sporulation protein A homolog n=1 Tax=Candidatus Weimeria bifida TaxID=2599074 RepID=A0A6N7IZQ8_9FIRM|nr:chemotaxis-specific protein-glutamate methyltransferase CheB [Candidatus Weimeria bifida]RRF96315.1 MAG: chemotaxis-specific protein-glutamate methyltransferase CheB [Lachnospiraceae bacterium]